MNKKRILAIGIPLAIRNRQGKTATIELNSGEFVVCKYHANDSVYLNDANLNGWYPAHLIKRLLYYAAGFLTSQ